MVENKITWKNFVLGLVHEFCDEIGKRTFTLREFYSACEGDIRKFSPKNHHPFDKVRQQLQFLRNDGLIQFLDGRGTYTLLGVDLLRGEVEDEKILEVNKRSPEKREYLIETYARNRGWVKEAKDKFGFACLYPECSNAFKKPDKTPYIEVHHIISLHDGGEDAIWNLAVVCAHHHKMAHFADLFTKRRVNGILADSVARCLESH
ncbi:MAG: HNH endonuclease [Nitrospinae bacterium]|nr:HNH endonuclease [Nitrospinota bacterium]